MNINKFTQNSLQAVQNCEKIAADNGNHRGAGRHDPGRGAGAYRGPAWPQRQRQDDPHQASQRPAGARRGRDLGGRPSAGEGEPCRGLLPARTQQPAPVDDGGPASGFLCGFLCRLPAQAQRGDAG